MEYQSAQETAEKWGISLRRVQSLLHNGRIPGARKYGRSWQIPVDAAKPDDPRRERKYPKPRPFYTLPRACPELLLSTLYNRPGSAKAITGSLAGDSQAQALFKAQLFSFQGKTEQAATLARNLLEKAARPDVRMGCCFVLIHAAMYAGDTAVWRAARKALAETPYRTPAEKDMVDFQMGLIDSAIYEKHSLPLWFKQGKLERLPLDSYPVARFIYLKYLLMLRRDELISFVCGPLIAQCRAEGAVLPEIYCRLISAVGCHDSGDRAEAAYHLNAAIALALPDRLLSPFAEMRSEYGTLLDELLAKKNKAACNEMIALNRKMMKGWNILCRDVRGVDYASEELTQQEHHVVRLAAKGLSNAEIAELMQVSVNAVKRYISEAIGKAGAKDREEFIRFVTSDSLDS